MTETTEEQVITIGDKSYTEDQLSDEAKACINHIGSLDQKIGSAQFNLMQLHRGRKGFLDDLRQALEAAPEEDAA